MSRLRVYTYKNCDTCRQAIKWLKARDRVFEERPIREIPPSLAELRAMLRACEGERRRLFNSSGVDYRALNLADKLPSMDDDEALDLLAGNGNLVKRPFVIGPGVSLVGFDERSWSAVFDS